ncbi:MAG TPA: 3-dehydroquinate synthase [Candidatus Elarobacter sp.]|nr:3-dehydroquinate synthase [Candidatus Elarobacter sp.]
MVDVAAPDRIPAGGYDVLIALGALDRAGDSIRAAMPAHRYAIVTDTNVGPLYAGRLAPQLGDDAVVITIPAGEEHKSRDTWASVTDQLLDAGLGRDSAIVALGGGVVCDLAGFVAATFMRGIPVTHVPTTLLAMTDASIGGKTGVDTPAGKNLVGAFHSPSVVVIDAQVLSTLPLTELRSGLAESIKHGAVADAGYFEELSREAPRLLAEGSGGRDLGLLDRVIRKSVRLKADVVAADEREKGARKTLNFGHTIGHAIELLSGFTVRHGEAVAIGMVLEARAGELTGHTEPGTADAIQTALVRAGLPVARPAGPSPEQLLGVMRGDKKSRAGAIEYAIPTRIGVMAGAGSGYGVRLSDAAVAEVLA